MGDSTETCYEQQIVGYAKEYPSEQEGYCVKTLFEIVSEESHSLVPCIDGLTRSIVRSRWIGKCMPEARIDVYIILFIEVCEIFPEEVDLLQWDTRVLITEYAQYWSLESCELSRILRQVAIVDHRSIDGCVERDIQRLPSTKAPTESPDFCDIFPIFEIVDRELHTLDRGP